MWTLPPIDSTRQDVGYAIRTLRRQAGLAATVITVLALAIGLNTTLFTVIAGIALRPWPGIADASRVVRIYLASADGRAEGLAAANARNLDGRLSTLSGVAVMKNESVRLGAGESIAPAQVLMVSGNFLELLGIPHVQERGFAAQEHRV